MLPLTLENLQTVGLAGYYVEDRVMQLTVMSDQGSERLNLAALGQEDDKHPTDFNGFRLVVRMLELVTKKPFVCVGTERDPIILFQRKDLVQPSS